MNQPTPIIGNTTDRASSPEPAAVAEVAAPHTLAPHELVRAVVQRLQNHPSLKFTRLNVHQCDHDAICLEGFLESNIDDIDLSEVVRGIHGIKQVVNHVVTAHPPDSVPSTK